MKIWFFLEGYAEVYFAKNLMLRVSPSFQESEDIVDFLTNPDDNLYYCTNCRGINNISIEIEQESYRIRQTGQIKIIIVCDKERAPCFSHRMLQVSAINDSLVKALIKVVIFDPMIEKYYWRHPRVIKKVLESTYQNKYGRVSGNVAVNQQPSGTIGDLKDLFRNYNVKYREREFAEEFFPKVSLESDSDLTITRARNLISP